MAAPDTSDRVSMLELDIPAPTPKPRVGDNLRAMIYECTTPGELEQVAAAFNSDTLTGKFFRALPRAVSDEVRALWRGMRCALVWALVWRSFSRALATPLHPTPAASPVEPVTSAAAPQAEIVPVLQAIQAETHRPTAAARSPFRAPVRVAPVAEVRRMRSGELIAGSIAHGQGALVSWTRGKGRTVLGTCGRPELLAALTTIQRTDDAPAAKSAAAHFGNAVSVLNSGGLVARRARRQGSTVHWPADVASRFVVGHVDSSANLGTLGDKTLIADLTDGGSVRFTGSETLAARVRADFETRVSGDVYTATDLIAWFERTLRTRHHAVSCGAHLYVPAGEVSTVRALITAIRGIMGRSFSVIPVVAEADLIAGLCEGLSDECTEIRDRFHRESERARTESRAGIGERMATTMLTELSVVRERVQGYAAMLGERAVASVRATIAEVDALLRPLVSATSERYAAMDLN